MTRQQKEPHDGERVICLLYTSDRGVTVGFLVFAIAAIPFIPKDVRHLGGAPEGFPGLSFDAAAVKVAGDLRCRLAAQVVFKHHADEDVYKRQYLYGYSTSDIAAALTELGRKTYLGNIKWTSNSIVQVLRNERHCCLLYTSTIAYLLVSGTKLDD